jgi:5-aminolevulinate synthase
MGKALAVQSTRTNAMLSGAFGGSRAYSSRTTRAPRAYLHTTRAEKAQAVDTSPLRRDEGTSCCNPTTNEPC